MNVTQLVLIVLGFGLAFVNGGNDVSKAIATLVGSGLSNYRRAIIWGTLWTAAGSLLGAAVAHSMITTFGKGTFAAGITPTLPVAVGILFGATASVLIATRAGLPVSTTHAIVGSLAGVATVAFGPAGLRWGVWEGRS